MTFRIIGLPRLVGRLLIRSTFPETNHAPTGRRLCPLYRRSSSTAHAFQPIDQPDEEVLEGTGEEPEPLLGSTESALPVVVSPAKIVLRDYQEEAIQACLDALSSGLTRIGVSSPTGSGKTTMFMHLIPKVPSMHPNQQGRGRTMILVSSVELANQAEMAAKRMLGDDWIVEVEQSKRHASGMADVTIATFQTLNNVDRLRKFDPRLFKLIIVDEAHHSAALSYLRLLKYFNEDVELPEFMSPIEKESCDHKVPIVGFSATFSRADKLALNAVFEKVVYHRELTAMLKDGWLSQMTATQVQADLRLDSVELNKQGEYKTSSLAYRVNTPEVNRVVVSSYLHLVADRRSTLVFCVDLKHVAALTQAFRDAGVDARSISSISRPQIRRNTIKAFSAGEFPVLVNCQVLTEGADIPEIDCIILARPTKSNNLLAQMVGRGLRLSPASGKEDCRLIDIVDNVTRSNGLLVDPTLLGLQHREAPRGREIELEAGGREDADEGEASSSSVGEQDESKMDDMRVVYIEQEDPFRLRKRGEMPLARISSNAWVFCGKGLHVLELLGSGYIQVALEEGGHEKRWTITYRQQLKGKNGKPFLNKPQQVALGETLEAAIQTADVFAERKMGRDMVKQLTRWAPWRQRQASQKALDMLLKMKGVNLRDGNPDMLEIDIMGRRSAIADITAGQVSAYLCAVRHGALPTKKQKSPKGG